MLLLLYACAGAQDTSLPRHAWAGLQWFRETHRWRVSALMSQVPIKGMILLREPHRPPVLAEAFLDITGSSINPGEQFLHALARSALL